MSRKIEHRTVADWLSASANYLGNPKRSYLSLFASGAQKNLPYGRIVVSVLGLSVLITTAVLSLLFLNYSGRIDADRRLDLQQKLFHRQLDRYEEQIDDLQRQVSLRRRTEGLMVSLMARYQSPLPMEDRVRFARFCFDESHRLGIDPLLAFSLIAVESGFDPKAVSSKGAVGMTQVLPYVAQDTASRVGIAWRGSSTLYDPFENTRIGLHYFKSMVERFKNPILALEAYNRGPTALQKSLDRGGATLRTGYSTKILALAKRYRSRIRGV